MSFTNKDRAESRAFLKLRLSLCSKEPDGRPRIFTVLRNVNGKGDWRKISIYVIEGGQPVNLSWHYDRAHGKVADDTFGMWANHVYGGGMDMGFALASTLAAIAGLDDVRGFRHEWI